MNESSTHSAWSLIQNQWSPFGWGHWITLIVIILLGPVALGCALIGFNLFFHEKAINTSLLPLDILVVIGSICLFSLVYFIRTLLKTRYQYWVQARIHTQLWRDYQTSINELSISKIYELQKTGSANTIEKSILQIENFLSHTLTSLMETTTLLIILSAILIYLEGPASLLILLLTGLFGIWSIKKESQLENLSREITTFKNYSYRVFRENLSNIRTIRTQLSEPFLQRRWETQTHVQTHLSLPIIRKISLIMGSNQTLGLLFMFFSAMLLLIKHYPNSLTLQQMFGYLLFMFFLFQGTKNFVHGFLMWKNFKRNATSVISLLSGDKKHVQSEVTPESLNIERRIKSIEIEKLSIGHPGKNLAKSLSFTINRGELWAIVGPSGCGKTTFLEVLAGLRPAIKGSVRTLDDNHQLLWEASSLNLNLPLSSAAYVEKHPYLFEGTLRENLMLGNTSRLSDVILWQFLERTQLYSWAKQKGGLDYLIDPSHPESRSGFAYLISVCRALLLKRPFLLLDEPFGYMNETTTQMLITTLETEKQHQGIVMATHFLPDNLNLDAILSFLESQKNQHYEQTIPSI